MLKTASHRPGGFTLIELMVVVILIGVVAAMVIPELGGSAETVRLDAAARRVADMMDFCSHAAASSGRVHALLFDQANRRFDVVCEPAPPAPAAATATAATPGAATAPGSDAGAAAPAEGDAAAASADADAGADAGSADPAAAGATGDSAAPAAGTDAGSADGTDGTGGAGATATSADATADQAAQLGLTRVPIPGFLDRTLPEGVGLSGLETYETDLSAGETEGQFKILFFPDGTTEFAKVELSLPSGQRRVVVLNGIGGTVSLFDPDRHGEIDMNTLVTDEDNPEDAATDSTTDDGSGTGSDTTGLSNGGGAMSGGGPRGGGMADGGNNELFGLPAGQ